MPTHRSANGAILHVVESERLGAPEAIDSQPEANPALNVLTPELTREAHALLGEAAAKPRHQRRERVVEISLEAKVVG